jgi:hypothetical protein
MESAGEVAAQLGQERLDCFELQVVDKRKVAVALGPRNGLLGFDDGDRIRRPVGDGRDPDLLGSAEAPVIQAASPPIEHTNPTRPALSAASDRWREQPPRVSSILLPMARPFRYDAMRGDGRIHIRILHLSLTRRRSNFSPDRDTSLE